MPFSLLLSVAIVVVAVITGADPSDGWAASAQVTLSEARWWTVFSALVAPGSAGGAAVSVALCLTVLPLAERALGTWRTALAFIAGGSLSVGLGVFAEAGVARWPGLHAADLELVSSPTLGLTVVLAAASASAGALWRRRLRMLIGAIVAIFALYSSDPASWVRLASLALGLALGWRWFGAPAPLTRWSSSVDERRKLVSGFVALVGLGPLAGLLSGGGHGPLAHAAAVFADVDRGLVARCSRMDLPVCHHETAAVVTRGLGLGLLAAMPLILLIVAAIGLRIGRRAAWFLALGTSFLLAIAAIVAACTGSVEVGGYGAAHAVELLLWGASAIGVPLAVVAILVITRRSFAVRADRRSALRFAALVAATFVILAGAYLLVEFLLRRAWGQPPKAAASLGDLFRRFLPQALLYDVGDQPFPHRGPALWLWQWVGVAFWIVAIAALLWLFRRASAGVSASRGDLIELLRETEAGTMSWPGTWKGTEHWFSADGRAAVSYRAVNGVALAISDPVCVASRREATLREFISFADEAGLHPVFYGVHQETASLLAHLGWQDLTVAEEALLHPATWSMAGKAGEKVRQPYNRMLREDVKAVWSTWDDLPTRYLLQIRRISEEWVADRPLPEMGFTLGSVPEMQPPEVRLLLAVSASDEVIGVTSWLPSWTRSVQTGWTLDVMRRAPQAPNGVMEFLIAAAVEQMRADGIETLSLSGAPLATAEEPDPQVPVGLMASVLGRVSTVLEPLYGFHSLNRFKKKFRPEHQRLAMSYSDPLQLGTIGLAVARAYLPFASRRESLALARGLFEREREA